MTRSHCLGRARSRRSRRGLEFSRCSEWDSSQWLVQPGERDGGSKIAASAIRRTEAPRIISGELRLSCLGRVIWRRGSDSPGLREALPEPKHQSQMDHEERARASHCLRCETTQSNALHCHHEKATPARNDGRQPGGSWHREGQCQQSQNGESRDQDQWPRDHAGVPSHETGSVPTFTPWHHVQGSRARKPPKSPTFRQLRARLQPLQMDEITPDLWHGSREGSVPRSVPRWRPHVALPELREVCLGRMIPLASEFDSSRQGHGLPGCRPSEEPQ